MDIRGGGMDIRACPMDIRACPMDIHFDIHASIDITLDRARISIAKSIQAWIYIWTKYGYPCLHGYE